MSHHRRKAHPISQHIVPQLLLRGFTDPATGEIWVYDKLTDNVFKSGTAGIGAEKGFYDYKVKGVVVSIDPGITKLERAADPILKSIISSRSIAGLPASDRALVSIFAAVQMMRGRRVRESVKSLGDTIVKEFRERGIDPTNIKNFREVTEEDARLISMKLVISAATKFAPYIYDKTWLLYQTSPPYTFWISDNPITLHNNNRDPFRGNLGIGVKGIQINLPIASDLSLAFYCHTTMEQFRKDYLKFKALSLLNPRLAARSFRDPLFNETLMRGLEEGSAVTLPDSSVIHLNSLQVYFSARFVYSINNNFNLVRRMIADDSGHRKGPVPIVNWPRSRA